MSKLNHKIVLERLVKFCEDRSLVLSGEMIKYYNDERISDDTINEMGTVIETYDIILKVYSRLIKNPECYVKL